MCLKPWLTYVLRSRKSSRVLSKRADLNIEQVYDETVYINSGD